MYRKILNVNLETVCAIIRLKSKNNTPGFSFIQSSFLQEIARYNFIIIAIINISIIIIIIVNIIRISISIVITVTLLLD